MAAAAALVALTGRCRGPLLLALAAVSLAGCAGDRPPAGVPAVVSFEPPRSDLFDGAPRRPRGNPYNAVAADMDGDGDGDLVVNWHISGPLELLENVGGRFRLANPAGSGEAGLFENRDVPWLYGVGDEMVPRALARGAPGVHVWHEPDRRLWHLLVVLEPGRPGPVLEVKANRPVQRHFGLEASEVEQVDPFTLRVRPAVGRPYRHLRVEIGPVGIQFEVALADGPGSDLGFFAGSSLVPLAGRSIELWRGDPHGIAWADVAGSPLPDLFVTRGGLQGKLLPPHDPKTDQLFVAEEASPVFYRQVAPGVIPSGYGRGRQVEWVDVDNDGRLELYLGNLDTPNILLARPPEGEGYQDIAPALGLDFEGGHDFAWLDLDGDGLDDLVVGVGRSIEVMRNLGGRQFERLPGRVFGLDAALGREPDHVAIGVFQVADLDNDGRLDLLANLGRRGLRLFLRREGFVDATAERGLVEVPRSRLLLPLDADNDGRLDLVAVGERVLLLHNRGTSGFETVEVVPTGALERVRAAAALDADGDGLEDLALIGSERYLLRNATRPPGGRLSVSFERRAAEPVGAVVRAFYDDGTMRTQRYGSAHNAAYTQALRPLDFNVAPGAAIEAIEVTWPGGRVTRHPVAAGQATLRLAVP